MDCPSCGAENPPHAKFCHACGTPVATGPAPCRVCGQPNDPGARYCVHCGAPDPSNRAAPVTPARSGSRQATLIVGGLVALAAAGAAAAWWLGGPSEDEGGGRPPGIQAPALEAPAASMVAPGAAVEKPTAPAAEVENVPMQTKPIEVPASAPAGRASAPATVAAPRPAAKPPAATQRQSPPQPAATQAPPKPAIGGGWYAEYLAARDECRRNSGNFFSRTACLEKTKWKYCNDGHWGEVPECPTSSSGQRP